MNPEMLKKILAMLGKTEGRSQKMLGSGGKAFDEAGAWKKLDDEVAGNLKKDPNFYRSGASREAEREAARKKSQDEIDEIRRKSEEFSKKQKFDAKGSFQEGADQAQGNFKQARPEDFFDAGAVEPPSSLKRLLLASGIGLGLGATTYGLINSNKKRSEK